MIDPFSTVFASIRTTLPNDVKAVNMYQRALPGVDKTELLIAFHVLHSTAQAALDGAQRGDFVRGVTFARGLAPWPTAWMVADSFESDTK